MLAEIGILGRVLWWAGLGVFFLVVVPVVVMIATRIVRAAKEIRNYAGDIQEHGTGIAANLDEARALAVTADLAGRVREGIVRYGRALERLVREG